ncbi:MAG: pyridoxal-dependent decarboxylase [Actinomycetota bacterium]|nr:pyridoxal-dependent decarboxylase [Actinomycetota bacterium]
MSEIPPGRRPMTTAALRRHGHEVVDLVVDHLEHLADGPPWQPVPPAVRDTLEATPLPADGMGPAELLERIRRDVLPYPFGNGHPRFFGWANPPPSLEGVLVDMIATAMNPSCAGGDHAAIHLERGVVRWLATLVGHPGDGVLVSGGSAGALTALAAARHRAARADGWDDRTDGVAHDGAARLVLYVSGEGHSSHRKAVRLLGLGDDGMRVVATDPAGRVDPAALRAAVADDRRAGRRPFGVVASAGVVSTGAIDPLAAIADVCAEHGLWFHVDGSLGGVGVLDERVAPRYAGMERADSLVLDPHKWLGVPVDCAAVLVRDLDELRSTFSLVPSYLRTSAGDDPWLSEYVFDQTRPFRALRLWATLAGAGRNGLAARVRRDNDHAARLAELVSDAADLELVAEPDLCVVVFRWRSGARAVDHDDQVNVALPRAVQLEGDVFLTGARLDGREVVRACFMHPGTTDDDIDRIIPAVRRAARGLTSTG